MNYEDIIAVLEWEDKCNKDKLKGEQMSKIYGIGDEEELAEDLQKELPNRIIEELEKTRREIEKLEYYYFDCNLVVSVQEVFDIINNHIEELKNKQ